MKKKLIKKRVAIKRKEFERNVSRFYFKSKLHFLLIENIGSE